MSAVLDAHGRARPEGRAGYHGPHRGILRWITTTNHKDIGTLYLVFAGIMFFIGGMDALVIRSELFEPGLQIVEPQLFNQLLTLHGLIMIFGAIMPAFVGFANWLIPMQIGAPDMAFARMNNWSFWILPFAASLLVISFLMPGGAPGVNCAAMRSSAAGGRSQNDRLFIRGNAMSGAPICIGISQFAKPTNAGMIAPKTMISP